MNQCVVCGSTEQYALYGAFLSIEGRNYCLECVGTLYKLHQILLNSEGRLYTVQTD
jgi:hypothetical protein